MESLQKKVMLLAVVAVLAVVSLSLSGVLFGMPVAPGVLGKLFSERGINFLMQQPGLLLIFIVLVAIVCAVVMAACRTKKT